MLKNIISYIKDPNLWRFMGSGLLVSVAYIDPGNWGTNIGGGASFNYDLLWVIWMASGMAMLFQYLSGKIGIAGYSLPELIHRRFKHKRWAVISYWLAAEAAILATDMAEFLGIVVALNLLFGVPLLLGTFIAMIDVLLLLLLTQKRFRLLEQAFIGFVGVVGLAFLYEVLISQPEIKEILLHSVKPMIPAGSATLVVGIIGATVMPHALFVHSWLIKNKVMETNNIGNEKKVLRYHLIDNVVSLTLAGLINASMLIMAAAAFHRFGYKIETLTDAYKTLIPLFGNLAATVFALALLSAGISSSITGTLAGQSIMDGLMGFNLSIWLRRLITRFINLIPLTIALWFKVEPLKILVYSQVVLSLMIPLPLIPIVLFTANKKIMGGLVNKKITTGLAVIFGLVILGFNAYLISTLFTG